MPPETIYEELGVPHVVNATGTKTRIGGSRIRPEAVDAMARASEAFVRLSDLQARASELIADVTGADAGYVASGAASALALGAAACIAGDDLGAMARLPDTEGVADEIVMARTHRTGYDHALRAAGATVVDVGTNDKHLGTGSRNVEPWEIEDAIGEDTAAVAYVEKSYTEPPLDVVCDIAHDNGVPVIVDAAAELPPTSNLSAFVDAGADLVAFSGGKAVRGPQTTGILAGREELVESVAAQHLDMHAAEQVWEPARELVDPEELGGVPRQGIGRPMKVGKEELVGLIRALELFVEEDHDALTEEWRERAERISADLDSVAGFDTSLTADDKTAVAPEVIVSVDPDVAGVSAADVVGGLRREEPRVFVGADALPAGEFTVNPMCLTDAEADYAVERIAAQVE
ncbi:aminotransferase class V-fold PLP-dependent enzyme (plasmid) [Halorussus limi]|uniref:Aminotransferase class V-fold PLP-dependent enzyme n=1 Tax=Halorussus limi TaxID=2938695 RepID=A0A8U0I0V1_9EURY|nr:aminotransferase class V-fold PLP-dependent enzyme [Halorussus limi]UPV76827.1 aminotransferase class V-fold PLP-dependent enzyme [Halorussus limi]